MLKRMRKRVGHFFSHSDPRFRIETGGVPRGVFANNEPGRYRAYGGSRRAPRGVGGTNAEEAAMFRDSCPFWADGLIEKFRVAAGANRCER